MIRTACSSLGILVWLVSASAWAQIGDDQCLKCHGQPWIAGMRPEAIAGMVRIPQGQSPVSLSAEEIRRQYTPETLFKESAHAGLACADCHSGIEQLPHNQRLATRPCGDCHEPVEKTIARGAHNPASTSDGRRRPTCGECHGSAHGTPRVTQPRTYRQAADQTAICSRCHNEARGLGPNPAATYRDNIHGKALLDKGLPFSATCVDCHGAHAALPPGDPESPISPLQAPKTCGRCHEGIADVFYASIHGQRLLEGKQDAATCTSCHDSHGIRAIDNPFLMRVVKECSHCHLKLGESYLASYHGKATSLGGSSAAVCSSCHGAHDIQPKSDPRSHVALANLVATCEKCHKGVNENFIKYITHANVRNRKSNPEVFYTWLVMTTLLLSVLAVFIPHGLLWFQRAFVERLRRPRGYHGAPPEERWVMRFHPIHRITHALIVVSFMGLVITGFPLKYNYTAWAHEIATALGGSHVMGMLHRGFAIVTFTYAAVHLGFLVFFFTKHCPRPRWKYLIGPDSVVLSFRDIEDFFAMVRWFFWLGPRPQFDRWTYYEKFDYWGEIWGIFLIGSTGVILWVPTFFTRWLPGWVLNCAMVIHSIEALLAASVIFLVHFFNTHLRPEKFPIDMVMLTGRMTETEMKEERAAEYQRLVDSGELERRLVPPVALKWRILGTFGGLIAFTVGIALIVLALRTEFGQLFR